MTDRTFNQDDQTTIRDIIVDTCGIPEEMVTWDANLTELGADSLLKLDTEHFVAKEFGISPFHLERFTFGAFVSLVSDSLANKGRPGTKPNRGRRVNRAELYRQRAKAGM